MEKNMNNYAALSALNEYKDTGNSAISYDDPHSLILRLMDGAIDRIAQAKGAIKQKNVKMKGELISKSIGIINGLDACLNHDQGGDLSANLASLYEYMGMRLLEANMDNDSGKLDEVTRLLGEIRSAWMQIPELAQK